MANKKEDLILATIDIVAEHGLENFSMKQVTNKVGVSEALLYKYFGNKDELLFSCYEYFYREIADVYENFSAITVTDKQQMKEETKRIWLLYYDCLIKGGNKTLYYFCYRDSNYMKVYRDRIEDAKKTYLKNLMSILYSVVDMSLIANKLYINTFWSYIVDTTSTFAKRIIRGEIEDTPQMTDTIWNLLFSGVSWIIE